MESKQVPRPLHHPQQNLLLHQFRGLLHQQKQHELGYLLSAEFSQPTEILLGDL